MSVDVKVDITIDDEEAQGCARDSGWDWKDREERNMARRFAAFQKVSGALSDGLRVVQVDDEHTDIDASTSWDVDVVEGEEWEQPTPQEEREEKLKALRARMDEMAAKWVEVKSLLWDEELVDVTGGDDSEFSKMCFQAFDNVPRPC